MNFRDVADDEMLVRECFVTFQTSQALAKMFNPDVSLQDFIISKLVWTNGTLKLMLSHCRDAKRSSVMFLLVNDEPFQCGERRFANVALVTLLFVNSPLVIEELTFLREGLIANLTSQYFLFS